MQTCIVQGTNSHLNKITCGIPQGSNLGPLLFTLYINDLPNCLKQTQASMFADDTNISTFGSSLPEIENKINNDLHNVNSWLETNKLTLNAKKTEFMLIASKRKLTQLTENPNIYIGNHNIKQVSKKKVLGILLDEDLKWKEHNNALCKTLSKSIARLKRARCLVTYEALIKMYNSLVLSHFTYCSNVWNNGSCAHMEKLYKMQTRAARILTGCSYETKSREIFERLG